MAVTGAEIARRVGCSPAAVSRAFNGTGPVSADVREAIMREARQVGYVPRRAKRSNRNGAGQLAMQTSEVVFYRVGSMERMSVSDEGVEVGPLTEVDFKEFSSNRYRLSGAFHRHILEGVVDELQHFGTKALLQSVNDLSEVKLMMNAGAHEETGVLLLGEFPSDLDAFVSRCHRPLVLIDILHRGWPDVVTIDNLGGIAQAVQHLADLGHRDIGYVGIADNPSFHERKVGFEWKMLELGLPVRPEWVSEGGMHIEPTTRRVVQLLKLKKRPTALVCCNDCTALGVLRAAGECELSVPKDLSVVGFDDMDVSAFTHPALTTVHVPTAELGRQAVRQLMIQPKGRHAFKSPGCTVRVQTNLIVRGTTRARS